MIKGKSKFILLLLAVTCVSTGSIFIRLAQAEASSIAVAAYRLIFSTLFLALASGKQLVSEIRRLTTRRWMLVVLSGTFLALHFITWVISLEYTSVSISTVLVTTTPIWVSIFSVLFLKIRLSWKFLLGLFFALTGVAVIAFSAKSVANTSLLGLFLALSGAWMAAGYFLANKKLGDDIPINVLVTLVYGVGALILLVIAAMTTTPLAGFKPITWLWFLLVALIPQALGHSGVNLSLKHIPAHIVTTALLAEPILASIMAYLFLNEPTTQATIAGGGLVLIGILLAIFSENKKKQRITSS